MARKPTGPKNVEALRHGDTRINIPTAEMQSFFQREEDHSPRPPTAYPRAHPLEQGEVRLRDGDKDPQIVWNGLKITLSDAQIEKLTETGSLGIGDAQLVWRGKDVQDWSDLIVNTPPLYIQEKIHPKAIIEDLKRQTAKAAAASTDEPGLFGDLFADFNGVPKDAASDFYQHPQHWSNRMILGDSLSVMASLAERERLKGKVQCVFFDPPYGIKFNSNWQVSTQSRNVKDGKQADISREPEQVKAFRDTWKDGIHSYLTYLRDRLTVMRDLLTESGSIFVQISDENVHRVRTVMDEVFGEENFVNTIAFKKKSATYVTETVFDYLIWYGKVRSKTKARPFYEARSNPEGESKFNTIIKLDGTFANVTKLSEAQIDDLLENGGRWARVNYPIVSQHPSDTRSVDFEFRGRDKKCGENKQWRFSPDIGLKRLEKANRLFDGGGSSLGGVAFWDDWNQVARSNIWEDIHGEKYPTYIVQTATTAIQRCILMSTDPGDLVLDPTCGSGSTAYVAEQWGRRWITIDTSRVALALARTRIMSARYPWYLLADSAEGVAKEASLTGRVLPERSYSGDIRQGFVYDRVPRIKLKSIADNARIDDIWEKWQEVMEPLRAELNAIASKGWEEWQVPRALPDNPLTAPALKQAHTKWWEARIARQAEIDKAIAEAADSEFLYDRPFPDTSKVRVAGPFTVESLSPHRIVPSDTAELIDDLDAADGKRATVVRAGIDFPAIFGDAAQRLVEPGERALRPRRPVGRGAEPSARTSKVSGSTSTSAVTSPVCSMARLKCVRASSSRPVM